MNKIKPTAKHILVRRSIHKEEKGALILPHQKEVKHEGTVIAVGCEVMEIDDGETVIWMPYAGTAVKSGDENLVMLSESDILGVRYE